MLFRDRRDRLPVASFEELKIRGDRAMAEWSKALADSREAFALARRLRGLGPVQAPGRSLSRKWTKTADRER